VSQLGWEPCAVPALWEASPPVVSNGAAQAWQPQTSYAVGTEVSFGGRVYRCRQAHMSQADWDPAGTPALWEVA